MTRGSFLDTIGIPEDDNTDPEFSIDFTVFTGFSDVDLRGLVRARFPAGEYKDCYTIQQFFGRLWLQLHCIDQEPGDFKSFDRHWQSLSKSQREALEAIRGRIAE